MRNIFKLLIDNIDNAILLIFSIVVSVLSYFGFTDQNIVLSGILAVLSLMSIVLLRNNLRNDSFFKEVRNQLRESMINNIDTVLVESNTSEIDKNLIRNADRELLLIQETGNLITNVSRNEIISFIQKGGSLKLIVASQNNDIMELLALRNGDLNCRAIRNRSLSFHEELESMLSNVNYSNTTLEIRYLPYPMGHTCVMCDTKDSAKAKGLIRYAGFQVPFQHKLQFEVERCVSPVIYENYLRQFEDMYYCSYKKVLLTGESKTGKTTLLEKLLEKYQRDRNSIYYMITKEIIGDNGIRTGFEIKCSNKENNGIFAKKLEDGTYEVYYEKLEAICDEINSFENYPIIILDEIGSMQVRNEKFIDTIKKIMCEKDCIFYATISMNSDENEIIEEIKRDYKTRLITLTTKNRESVINDLTDEMNGSIKMITYKK